MKRDLPALLRRTCQERRAVCFHDNATRTGALSNQHYLQRLLRNWELPAVATMRRVGDRWRVYVLPFDERPLR